MTFCPKYQMNPTLLDLITGKPSNSVIDQIWSPRLSGSSYLGGKGWRASSDGSTGQLLQKLPEPLFFVVEAIYRRGHGGRGDVVIELLQLDNDLGRLQHDDGQQRLGRGHLLLKPWREPRSVHQGQFQVRAGVRVQLTIGLRIQEWPFQPLLRLREGEVAQCSYKSTRYLF